MASMHRRVSRLCGATTPLALATSTASKEGNGSRVARGAEEAPVRGDARRGGVVREEEEVVRGENEEVVRAGFF